MEKKRCPVCGGEKCMVKRTTWYRDNDLCANEIKCETGFHFIVHDDVD